MNYRILLTEQFKNAGVNEENPEGTWGGLANATAEVFSVNIDDPRFVLQNIRYERYLDRTLLIKACKQLGFNFNSDSFNDEELRRLVTSLGLYYQQKGSVSFSNFMGYIKDSVFQIKRLWTDDFENFVYKTDLVSGQLIYNGGDFYPTSHVALSFDSSNFPVEDESDLYELFYKIAPIHLVLERVESIFYFPPEWVYLSKPIPVIYSIQPLPNYRYSDLSSISYNLEFGSYPIIDDYFGVHEYNNSKLSVNRPESGWATDRIGNIYRLEENIPRIDYADGQLLGVLIEKSRRNLIQFQRINVLSGLLQNFPVPSGSHTLSMSGSGQVNISGVTTGVLTETNPIRFNSNGGLISLVSANEVRHLQLEIGNEASSPIPIYNANVAADNLTYGLSEFPLRHQIFVLSGDIKAVMSLCCLGSFNSNSSDSGLEIIVNPITRIASAVVYDQSGVGVSSPIGLTALENFRLAIYRDRFKLYVSINGSALELNVSNMSAWNNFKLGRNLTDNIYLNGHVKFVMGWSKYLNNVLELNRFT